MRFPSGIKLEGELFGPIESQRSSLQTRRPSQHQGRFSKSKSHICSLSGEYSDVVDEGLDHLLVASVGTALLSPHTLLDDPLS